MIRFCPLKIISEYFRSFYTVNTQNLKESEMIYKGQNRFTKVFLEINVARFAHRNETFLAVFKHCGPFLSQNETRKERQGDKLPEDN